MTDKNITPTCGDENTSRQGGSVAEETPYAINAEGMTFEEQEEELRKYDVPPLKNVGYFVRVFSFKGRISRTEYALSHLIIPGYFVVMCFVNVYADISSLFIGSEGAVGTYDRILWSCLLVTTWFCVAQGVKRCHDVGWSGWCIYIPFVHLLMLFKRGTGVVNAYGQPPLKTSDDTALNERMRTMRRRGSICSLLWLAFSPVWLCMTVRWRIQRWPARILLFLVSPFWVMSAYTVKMSLANSKVEEVRNERVKSAVSKAVTGIDFNISGINPVPGAANYGAETYVVTLAAPPSDILLSQTELLSTVVQSGWSAYADKAMSSVEDYGYYREDYGEAVDSLDRDRPKAVYVFTKDVQLKGDRQNSRVTLCLQRGENDVEVVIQPLAASAP